MRKLGLMVLMVCVGFFAMGCPKQEGTSTPKASNDAEVELDQADTTLIAAEEEAEVDEAAEADDTESVEVDVEEPVEVDVEATEIEFEAADEGENLEQE